MPFSFIAHKASIAILLTGWCLNAQATDLSSSSCNALLSGRFELSSMIHDLAKLRYDLDQRLIQGAEDAVTRELQKQYAIKEAEALAVTKMDKGALITHIRSEIGSIQNVTQVEANVKKEHRTQIQETAQKIERQTKTGSYVQIKAGTFMMGSGDSGTTSRKVTLKRGYEMMTTPVTQKQYFAMTGENPSQFKTREHCPDTYDEVNEMCPENPVEMVNWMDAQAFIEKLNAEDDGYLYRLPTEAEWEYAARGGTTTAYYWGDSLDDAYAWHNGNSGDQTHEVAKKKPNAYGLYDMSGNVLEWLNDCYQASPKSRSSTSFRNTRGGYWGDSEVSVRSGHRNFNEPSTRYSGIGFRLVRTRR